jgi:hypothetical protein
MEGSRVWYKIGAESADWVGQGSAAGHESGNISTTQPSITSEI